LIFGAIEDWNLKLCSMWQLMVMMISAITWGISSPHAEARMLEVLLRGGGVVKHAWHASLVTLLWQPHSLHFQIVMISVVDFGC
jgi:hypothetical protein